MSATTFDLEIWFDGKDEPLAVRADQRDMAAFELEYHMGFGKALDDLTMVVFRFLGWSAARRIGKVPQGVSRDDWLETVLGVEPVDEPESADPGKPAASEESLSS